MNKSEWIMAVVFALVGGLFAVLGFFIHADNSKFMETAVETQAEIISIRSSYNHSSDSTEYDVFVEFEVDGKTYSGNLNAYHSGMREGGTTTIYYNPDNPGDFKSSGTGFGIFMFIGMGLLFFAIGCAMIVKKIKGNSKDKYLKQNGTLIHAKIDEVEKNTSYTVNGRHPYKLTASYQDPTTGQILTFESKNIWFNIKAIVSNSSIETVPVYLDPADSKKYFVDVDDLKSYLGN